MKYNNLIYLVISLFLFLPSCESAKVEVGYQPPVIPLKVKIDTNGQISFSVSKEYKIPTHLGTISVGVVIDPIKYFKIKNNYLLVKIDGTEKYYDLHGEDFDIEFESGYYKKIHLYKKDENIFLTVERGFSPTFSPSSTVVKYPTNTPTQIPLCDSSYKSRLRVGDRAYVSYDPLLPNRVREAPSVNSNTIGLIEPGEEVKIEAGPECSNRWFWWKIRSLKSGLSGWTSEGDEVKYWLILSGR